MAFIVWTLITTLISYPTTSLVTGALGLLLFLYYVRRPKNLPPGPWAIPYIGSPYMFGDDAHKDFIQIGKKYGDIFTIMMGTRPMIVMNSHRLVKEAFVKRADVFSNRPTMSEFDNMGLCDEIFNHGYTEEWKVNKKFQTRALRNAGFGSKVVEPIFHRDLEQLYALVDAQKEKPIDVRKPLQTMLASTVATVVYGAHYNFGDEELEQLVQLALAVIASQFTWGMSLGYLTDNLPSWISKMLFPKTVKRASTALSKFHNFLSQKIQEHRATLDPNNPRDVIDNYLLERGDDSALTEAVFGNTILILFPDAIDSAPKLLDFIVCYLAHNPGWQRGVQKQIDAVCGERQPVLNDRSSLSKVEATIYEVARLASVITMSVAHSPTHDTTFEGYFIPEDSYILANIYSVHMDKSNFPQGARFDPESHLDEEEKFVRNDNIMPFGIGRRMCIGEQMVKNEAFLFVSTTLQRYTIKFPDGEPWPPIKDSGGLTRILPPYKVCFVPRK